MEIQHASRPCPTCTYGLVTCVADAGEPVLSGLCGSCGNALSIASSDLPKTQSQTNAELLAANASLAAQLAQIRAEIAAVGEQVSPAGTMQKGEPVETWFPPPLVP